MSTATKKSTMSVSNNMFLLFYGMSKKSLLLIDWWIKTPSISQFLLLSTTPVVSLITGSSSGIISAGAVISKTIVMVDNKKLDKINVS